MINNNCCISGDRVLDIQRDATEHRATWTGLTYTKGRDAGLADETEKTQG